MIANSSPSECVGLYCAQLLDFRIMVGLAMIGQGQAMQLLGYVSDGTITLSEAGTQAESPVAGSFRGRLLQFGCLAQAAAPPATAAP